MVKILTNTIYSCIFYELFMRFLGLLCMGKQKTILIVDDDEMVRRLLFEVFRFYGFNVQTVNDGIAALDILKKEDFDIIITDYSMPGMDGIELAKILRLQYPHSLIIGISADCDERNFLSAGADVFLHKPFSLQELLSIIQQKY